VTVLDAGVDDDECRLPRHGDEPVLERAAVEQDRVALTPEQRRGLVENPARHADRAQLCTLTCERQLERLELEVGDGAERKPDGDLERSRGREARADRQVRRQRAAEPDRRASEEVELGGDGLRVAHPAFRCRSAPVRRERRRSAEALRDQRHVLVDSGDVERDAVLDRDRQHEPAAVVGVLADQVYATRRPRDADACSRLGHGPDHTSACHG